MNSPENKGTNDIAQGISMYLSFNSSINSMVEQDVNRKDRLGNLTARRSSVQRFTGKGRC